MKAKHPTQEAKASAQPKHPETFRQALGLLGFGRCPLREAQSGKDFHLRAKHFYLC